MQDAPASFLSPTSTLQRLITYGVPVLLILLALWQIYLALFHHLSPWKGGGFGMFSSTDHLGTRALGCEAQDIFGTPLRCKIRFKGMGARYPMNKDLRRRLQAMPDEHLLQTTAQKFLHSKEFLASMTLDEGYELYIKMRLGGKDIDTQNLIRGVRLSMWRIALDKDSSTLKAQDMGILATAGDFRSQK